MCLKIKNRAIYPVSFRNGVQSMPETVCSISRNAGENPRGLYHAITPEQPCKVLHSQSSGDRYRPEPEPAGTAPTESARNDRTKPEQLVTLRPRRIFRSSPVRGLYSRCNAPLLPCKEVLSAGFLQFFQPQSNKTAGAAMPRLEFYAFCGS